jgi:hypothetical protein
MVDAFVEQTEASVSVDPLGSVRVYMVLELKEMRDGAMVPASKMEVRRSAIFSEICCHVYQ